MRCLYSSHIGVAVSSTGYIALQSSSTSGRFYSTASDRAGFPMRGGGVFTDLHVSISANSRSASCEVALALNGTATALAVSVPSSTTGTYEDADEAAAAADDIATYKVTPASGSGTITVVRFSVLFDAKGTSITVGSAFSSSLGAGPLYRAVAGSAGNSETNEAVVEIAVSQAGTLDLAGTYVYSNSADASFVFTLRKNAADTSVVITVPSSTTGRFEDTTNSATVAAGDKLAWKLESAVTSGWPNVSVFYMRSTFMMSGYVRSSALSSQSFATLNGDTGAATESLVMTPVRRLGMKFKHLRGYVSTNTRNATTTHSLRLNGANAISFTVPASTTGSFGETSTTCTPTATTDTLNLMTDWSAGSSGSGRMATLSIQQLPVEVAGTMTATAAMPSASDAGPVDVGAAAMTATAAAPSAITARNDPAAAMTATAAVGAATFARVDAGAVMAAAAASPSGQFARVDAGAEMPASAGMPAASFKQAVPGAEMPASAEMPAGAASQADVVVAQAMDATAAMPDLAMSNVLTAALLMGSAQAHALNPSQGVPMAAMAASAAMGDASFAQQIVAVLMAASALLGDGTVEFDTRLAMGTMGALASSPNVSLSLVLNGALMAAAAAMPNASAIQLLDMAVMAAAAVLLDAESDGIPIGTLQGYQRAGSSFFVTRNPGSSRMTSVQPGGSARFHRPGR